MTTSLSEKAKGKQRAVDPPEIGQTSLSAHPPSRDLTIRFTEGVSDLIVHVGERDTVKDVKQKVFGVPDTLERKLTKYPGQIRDARPELQKRRLRLIHSGRLLTDGTFIYSWLTSLEDKQRKAIKEVTTEEDFPNTSKAFTWLHCSVGPELTHEEEEEDLAQVRIARLHHIHDYFPPHPH